MNQKLIVTRQDCRIISAIYDDKDMISVNVSHESEKSILGNIYIGKVKNIVKNIGAAFVEIKDGQMCYLSLTEHQNPVFSKPKKNREIQVGDEFLVQISKEDIKTKAPAITTNMNFTGKYVVLVHGKSSLGISSKITEESERRRLKKIMGEFVSETYGFIVRTNAIHVSEDKIIDEVESLRLVYEDILRYGIHKSAFSLLFETPPSYLCDIRDGFAEHMDEIITDDAEIYDCMKTYLQQYQKEDLDKLRFYQDTMISMSKLYSLGTKLDQAMKEKVWLKSGAYIIIQPTEALTVIDVNTGKAVSGKKQIEETFLKVNLEAAHEIAKQLRLRNLSGIILIDFIDLSLEENKKKLMKELEQLFLKDPVKTTLVDMTALNLIEVTRKKVRKPLHEQVMEVV